MTCPNVDDVTIKTMKSLGFSIKNDTYLRQKIFYTLCITLRLFLAGLVLNFKDSKYIHWIIFFINLFTFFRLIRQLNGVFWWSRKFHLFTVCLSIIVSFMIITKKTFNFIKNEYLGYILYLDVGFGFIHSLITKRC